MMRPVGYGDTDKPWATFQACVDECNAAGARGTLTWPDGFGIPLGTLVRVATTTPDADGAFALVFAVEGFEQGGGRDGGLRGHWCVNWAAEDPPLLFSIVDDDGRVLEFSLIEPSVEAEVAASYADWRERFDADVARREECMGYLHALLAAVPGWHAAAMGEEEA
jgi:hypothetical protein